ncbi:MAG: hypothetical protein ACK401_04780 [Archaeoglobaceae archaeon]
MDMLRLEFDIQHHLVLSKRNFFDHALIRVILSTLASPYEIANLSKKDLRMIGKNFAVRFAHGRFSPIDEETFKLVNSLEKERPFELEESKMDEIVAKYSPSDKKYTAKKLRKAMMNYLQDASFFECEIEKLGLKELLNFMLDFNPLYSGSWLDEDGLKEFILNYSAINGIGDAKRVAEETGIDYEFVLQVMRTEKSLFVLADKFKAKNLSPEDE